MRIFKKYIVILCLALTFSKNLADSETSETSESDDTEELEPKGFKKISPKSEVSEEMKVTSCRSPQLKEGVCMHLEDCEEIINFLSRPLDDVGRNLIKASKKVCEMKKANGICCPNSSDKIPEVNLLPPVKTCGLVQRKKTFQKIVGGKDSEIGAWPWLALVGYKVASTVRFGCAGSLVTTRHVITAAHCVSDFVTFVRLGEYDFSTDNETKHLDVQIAKSIAHEEFSAVTGLNDVGVLFLEKNVEFTDLILPICLPISPELRSKSYVGSKPFVAGWGRTKEKGNISTVLQELQTSVYDNDVCYKAFVSHNSLAAENQFDNSVLCVGDLKGGKDTCQGDSGGPLMMPEYIEGRMHFFLIGIVSHGIGCARSGVAGAFTNVAYHLDWILKLLNEK